MTSTTSIPIPDLTETLPAETISAIKTTHILPAPFHQHYDSNTASTTPATSVPELLTQGAEALVYKTTFISPSTPAALKFRPSKPYRHPTLDARLTKQRVLAEARVLVKLSGLRREGIVVPAVLGLEWDVGRKVKNLDRGEGQPVKRVRREGDDNDNRPSAGAGAWILMEWIEGKSVKELLRSWDEWYKAVTSGGKENTGDEESMMARAEEEVKKLLRRIGKAVAAMHDKGGVIHGDLTSSNIMVRPLSSPSSSSPTTDKHKTNANNNNQQPIPPDLTGEIVLIDFGLATQSVQEEDRAVDLYVLERAFGSTHPRQEGWFDAEVLQSPDGYRGAWKGSGGILRRLDEVRMRGRKRTMIG